MMKKTMRFLVLTMWVAVVGAQGYSNPIEGGSTQTVSNQWNVAVPWLMVGSNTEGNSLVVDGGQVNNQIGYIGNTSASSNNSATVTGAGSVWNSAMELSVGNQGSGNTFTVADGGRVDTANGYIGNNSGSNTATIDGSGSLLNAATLHVGHLGSDNSLTVSGGGRVESSDGAVGYWIGSDNNTLTVTGNGSILATPEIHIGGSAAGAGGIGNLIEVENGGTVATTDLNIYSGNQFDLNKGGTLAVSTNFNASMSGFNFNSGGTLEVGGELIGMSGNIEDQRTLVLNGSNAFWGAETIYARVGRYTSGNKLVVTNGAQVLRDVRSVGGSEGSDGNMVVISGEGSLLQNPSGFQLGRAGSGNSLLVSEGGSFVSHLGVIGGGENASNNLALITGDGSSWSMASTMIVGGDGSSNQLVIADGGSVHSEYGVLGNDRYSVRNNAAVTGSNSLWNIRQALSVGRSGSGNTLTVSDGGNVKSSSLYIGNRYSLSQNSNRNAVNVKGEGSSLVTRGEIYVGAYGAQNRLEILDGGSVSGDVSFVGVYKGTGESGRNGILISGEDSVLSNKRDVVIGYYGNANTLDVLNGGTLSCSNAFLGGLTDMNITTVSGQGSTLDNLGDLAVGFDGDDNVLTITENGMVLGRDGFIGHEAGAKRNRAVVSGVGSVWSNSGCLTVGYFGIENKLEIKDGGVVQNRDGVIGEQVGANGNSVLVTGAGSVWKNREALYLGGYKSGTIWVNGGTGNSLTVSNGGWVQVGDIGTNNIPDHGAIGVVSVGGIDGAEMIIANGSRVENDVGLVGGSGYIGGFAQATDSNTALVTGSGSVWSNSGSLFVGYGTGNSLSIEDGGCVDSTSGWIGASDQAMGNTVIVSGTGSEWNISTGLDVGVVGEGSQLIVSNGAHVVNGGGGTIGNASIDNHVLVTGTGSVWHNDSFLTVGCGGSGNTLSVSNGGRVESGSGLIGDATGASNNRVIVSGAGSVWENRTRRLVFEHETGPFLASTAFEEFGNRIAVSDNSASLSAGSFLGGADGLAISNALISGGSLLGGSSGQRHINDGSLIVGYLGSNNHLSITDKGRVENTKGYIGYATGADSNSVLVADEDSLFVTNADSFWKNNEALYLGGHKSGTNWVDGGVGNSLIVEVGGWVLVGKVDANNFPGIRGSGANLVVGDSSGTAEMIAANGSKIKSSMGYIGLGSNESGSVTVSGTGSVWDSSVLHIGYDGSGSTLRIEDGAEVWSPNVLIGYGGNSSNNQVVVSGSGAMLKMPEIPPSTGGGPTVTVSSGYLFVGLEGSSNVLEIRDGALVEGLYGVIGGNPSASNNVAQVFGAGSQWRNSKGLYLGGLLMPDFFPGDPDERWIAGGTGNSLTVSSGGWMQVGDIGTNNLPDIGTFGVVSVGGLGSAEMVVANGSRVVSDLGYLGLEANMHGSVMVTGAGSVWENAGGLDVGYGGSGNSLLIEGGARVSSGMGFIGRNASASSNRVVVSGVGSVWNNGLPGITLASGTSPGIITPDDFPVFSGENLLVLSSGDVFVGWDGSANSLGIDDGAWVSNQNAVVGGTSTAWSNSVAVMGEDSVWHNKGNLFVGGRVGVLRPDLGYGEFGWIDGGRGNSLYVADGGLVSVGRDMHNRNYSVVSVDPGGHIAISSNYYQDATSVLRFGVETNAAGAPLSPFVSVSGTAEFEEGATLQYHSNVGVLDFDTFYTNLIVEANQLIIAGVTNANALDLTALNLDGSLVDLLLWEKNQNIYGLVGRKYLADSAGFAPGSQMAGVSREIDDLSLLGNPLAMEQINRLNGMSSAQQNAQLTQRYTQGTPTHRHQQSMQGGQKQVMVQSRSFQSINRTQGATPEGAAGPHKAEQGLRGWMRGYGSWANHDGAPSFSGFDQTVYGTVVGLDKVYGNVLLGVAGGYSRSDLTQDNHDSSDADTGFGVLYASLGSADWFGDLNVSYGRSGIKTRSGTALGGEGNFDADNYAVYLGGGKVIQSTEGEGVLLTPEAALLLGYYDQEGYNDGLMDVDAYDRWSCQSRLGAALAFEKQAGSVLLKPEVRVYWLHEFNADPDQIGYSLGGGRYTFGVQAPDEDIIELGVGFSATFNDRLEIVLDIDAQHSDLYQATILGARAMYEF